MYIYYDVLRSNTLVVNLLKGTCLPSFAGSLPRYLLSWIHSLPERCNFLHSTGRLLADLAAARKSFKLQTRKTARASEKGNSFRIQDKILPVVRKKHAQRGLVAQLLTDYWDPSLLRMLLLHEFVRFLFCSVNFRPFPLISACDFPDASKTTGAFEWSIPVDIVISTMELHKSYIHIYLYIYIC